MVYVVATIETAAGRRSDVLGQFAQIVPMVLQEEGCVAYAPAVDLATSIESQADVRENVITVVEQWESIEALERHLVAAHMIEFRGAVKDLVLSVRLQIVGPA